MKSNLIFLLFLIFFASCTIQKRVHNRGWHVQWNAKRSVSNQDSKEEKSTIELAEMSEVEDEKFSRNSETVEPSVSQPIEELSPPSEHDIQHPLDEVKMYESPIIEHSSVHPSDSVVYKIKNGNTNRSTADRDIGDFVVPILFFILAGFAVAVAVYFVMVAQTAGNLIGLIALFGAVVSGGVAMALIIIAIISLTVVLTVRNTK